MFASLKGLNFGNFILMVRSEDNWHNDTQKNCMFIEGALGVAEGRGHKAAVMSDHDDWMKIAGADCEVDDNNQRFLIWQRKDGWESMRGFKPFGGFVMPVLKVFTGPVELCNNNLDLMCFLP
eukprot:TRINITY_DN7186_c0_g1_i1.p4 TRINITY_DN7186_c0_g1~~TRINITY_DN7186_c0_g1_i1.p4  ORF type:complete len:122 (-),score=41.23 TRINITY_DN7186_c0_g1_i1:75-440(-)